MNRKDWVLMVIAAAKDGGLSPVQLQKSLFLFSKYMPEAVGRRFYQFIPYNYGPFNKSIYSDADALAEQGLVIVERESGRSWSRYSASPTGIERVKQLEESISGTTLSYLRSVVSWCTARSFQQLVSGVYENFPEYRKNSVFQD